jgi:hypothetical protein
MLGKQFNDVCKNWTYIIWIVCVFNSGFGPKIFCRKFQNQLFVFQVSLTPRFMTRCEGQAMHVRIEAKPVSVAWHNQNEVWIETWDCKDYK